MRNLPEETLPPVILKFNSDRDASISIALSGALSVRELTEIADKIVKPRLERSSGVGEVQIVGGLERTINIWVDADRLAAYRLPITEIQTALARQNQDAPGGNVTAGSSEQVLRTTGRLTDPEAFNDLVIKTVDGAPIRIRDIGRAEDGTKEQRSIARLNGVPTVVLEIRRQIGLEHDRSDRRGEAEPRDRQDGDPARHQRSRSSATSRATSTRRSTRSTCT